jgi:hypothetical protein
MTDRERSRNSTRDEAPRGRGRDEAPRRGRDDEPRGRESSRSGRGRDDEEAPRGRSSGRSSYEYQARSAEDTKERASKGANDYDKILKSTVKAFKVNDGDNVIRPLPPTWKGAKHFGLDIYVHYGVGADRGQYLCPAKMKNEPCPICEERERARKTMDGDNKDDAKYLKDLEPKRRVLIYLVDREHEREGVQAWAMPWTVDRDIVKVSVDKRSGEVLPIDHPEDGYDVEFEKQGAKDRTEYLGIAIARRESPLGKEEWLEFAMDNPLPDQLNYFSYEEIEKAFGGGGSHREAPRDREEARGGRGRDRDDEPRGQERGRAPESDELTWESIHEMTGRELESLIDQERLAINPDEAKDDADLADWICEEMKLKKAEAKTGRRVVAGSDDDEDRLRKMRSRRD